MLQLHLSWGSIEPAPEAVTGLDIPLPVAFQKPRLLDQSEEMGLFDKSLEVSFVVTSEFVVFEVHPEPSPTSAVVNVEGSRFRIARNHQKDQHSRGKLNPPNNFGLLSSFQKPSHSTFEVWCWLSWDIV